MWIKKLNEEGYHVSVLDFIDIVGEPPTEDFLDELTLSCINARIGGMSYENLHGHIREDWLNLLIKHNEYTEEYEACDVLHKIKESKPKNG